MVLSCLLTNESMVGVDIGSSNIKIVCIEQTRGGLEVTHAAMCPTPPDSMKEGVVTNIPEVASAIQFALKTAGIKSTNAVTAIAGPGVIVRQVQMPAMTEQVLRKSIYFEAGKHISASIDDSIVEFEILGQGHEPGQMNVLIVATPKPMIESKVAALEQAGLEPLSVDVEAFATFRALIEENPDIDAGSTVALLDIGESCSEINLVCDGRLELTRSIPIAGRSLTNAIKNAEGCTEEEAEQLKYTMDLGDLVNSADSVPPPGLKVVQSLIDEMLREIRRSINYYQSQLPDGAPETAIDRLIFTGGSAGMRGLLAYAGSRLKVDVSMGIPGMRDGVSVFSLECKLSEAELPLYSVAFGLAVKEMQGTHRQLAA